MKHPFGIGLCATNGDDVEENKLASLISLCQVKHAGLSRALVAAAEEESKGSITTPSLLLQSP